MHTDKIQPQFRYYGYSSMAVFDNYQISPGIDKFVDSILPVKYIVVRGFNADPPATAQHFAAGLQDIDVIGSHRKQILLSDEAKVGYYYWLDTRKFSKPIQNFICGLGICYQILNYNTADFRLMKAVRDYLRG